jgi:hypothetical protein
VNLDIIIASHSGRPKISVKMRCLEVLKKYGISPIRLIRMIEKNNVLTVCLSPFRLYINVRDSWAEIIISIGDRIELLREDEVQNTIWVVIIRIVFIIRNKFIDGLIELNLNGSKDEKISGIISRHGGSI